MEVIFLTTQTSRNPSVSDIQLLEQKGVCTVSYQKVSVKRKNTGDKSKIMH